MYDFYVFFLKYGAAPSLFSTCSNVFVCRQTTSVVWSKNSIVSQQARTAIWSKARVTKKIFVAARNTVEALATTLNTVRGRATKAVTTAGKRGIAARNQKGNTKRIKTRTTQHIVFNTLRPRPGLTNTKSIAEGISTAARSTTKDRTATSHIIFNTHGRELRNAYLILFAALRHGLIIVHRTVIRETPLEGARIFSRVR